MKKPLQTTPPTTQVSKDDLDRVLEIGRLLLSVLTEEEIEQLQDLLSSDCAQEKIGNTGVT
jgi:hypothetical protein